MHPLGSALVVLVGFSDDCRLIVPVLVLFVFFVLVIIIVVGISRRHRAADDGYEAPINQPEGLVMLGVMSALLFGCRDIHGRILAHQPGGPRKGAAIRLPLERESMALDRSNVLPAAGTEGHLSGRDRASRCPTFGSLAAGAPTTRRWVGLSTQTETEALRSRLGPWR